MDNVVMHRHLKSFLALNSIFTSRCSVCSLNFFWSLPGFALLPHFVLAVISPKLSAVVPALCSLGSPSSGIFARALYTLAYF